MTVVERSSLSLILTEGDEVVLLIKIRIGNMAGHSNVDRF